MLHNPEDVSSLSNLKLNKFIRAYYHRSWFYLSASDQHLLQSAHKELIQRSLLEKRAWLCVAYKHASIYLRQHANIMHNVSNLDAFFDIYCTIAPPPP